MKKLMRSKFSWAIVVAVVAVSVLFAVFACNGTNGDLQEITRATTNFTQTIIR